MRYHAAIERIEVGHDEKKPERGCCEDSVEVGVIARNSVLIDPEASLKLMQSYQNNI